jgi:hypothetical protein
VQQIENSISGNAVDSTKSIDVLSAYSTNKLENKDTI